MRCKPVIFFILIAAFLFQNKKATASHIVGGEVYYTCKGGSVYDIRLSIYQDCIEGDQGAIANDTPAFIGVYNLQTGVGEVYTVRASENIRVPANFDNKCVNNPPQTCLNKVTFRLQANLQPNAAYRVVYVGCCRNASIRNIKDPGTTGATYYCDIPALELANCNNSAVFKNFPPQIICINNPLVYDHSATDADGDSLSYELCEAYQGSDLNDPKPTHPPMNIAPPVIYVNNYGAKKPMGGNPIIHINATTGVISGTPNQLGRYVVTVCCHEWRHGTIINTVRREFQFNVTNCSKAVVARIPQFSTEDETYIVQCHDYGVKFINQSSGGFAYKWRFGVNNATSADPEPVFIYPDTGIYKVTLVVNEGSTCPDSISKMVKIFPDYSADFDREGLPCPGMPIAFTDKSVATYKPVVSWNWSFGDGQFSTEANPVHAYTNGGNYMVSLVSTSIKGCKDTAVKNVWVEHFIPFAGNDTVIVKGESIDFKATGGNEYTWTPPDRLNYFNIPNPTGYYPDTGSYGYLVHIRSASGCEGNDSINVLVVNDPYLFVPSAFTPNRDGLNDFFRPLAAGYRNVRFLRVFNRWGQVVFQTNNFSQGWDGTLNGTAAEIGVYYWVLGVTDRFGNDKLIKGDVTLIK